MKELSIEQKAKAYDEAKARISRAFDSNRCTIGFMNEIFPELKESEDEKLREQVVYAINQLHVCECTKTKLLAWLEKQKPDEWSREDKDTLERIISFINSFVDKDSGEVVLNEEIFTDDAQQELKRYVDFLRNIENIKN